jgi:hypothetical protein
MHFGQLRVVSDAVCDAMKSGFQVTVRWRAFDASEDEWSPKHIIGAVRNEGRSGCAGGSPDARDNLVLYFEESMNEFVSARLYAQDTVAEESEKDEKTQKETRLMLQWVKQTGNITDIVAANAFEVACETTGAQFVITIRDESGNPKFSPSNRSV